MMLQGDESHSQPTPLSPLQHMIHQYRDKLYMEILRKKKEMRRRMKEREAARASRGTRTGGSNPQQQQRAAAPEQGRRTAVAGRA